MMEIYSIWCMAFEALARKKGGKVEPGSGYLPKEARAAAGNFLIYQKFSRRRGRLA